ncbi:hypothetical protein P3T36_006313 [Kitasatospora sp. MAP12-15]|nr:hypothetical protein [Kitasatospora sp. MAP12-44]
MFGCCNPRRCCCCAPGLLHVAGPRVRLRRAAQSRTGPRVRLRRPAQRPAAHAQEAGEFAANPPRPDCDRNSPPQVSALRSGSQPAAAPRSAGLAPGPDRVFEPPLRKPPTARPLRMRTRPAPRMRMRNALALRMRTRRGSRCACAGRDARGQPAAPLGTTCCCPGGTTCCSPVTPMCSSGTTCCRTAGQGGARSRLVAGQHAALLRCTGTTCPAAPRLGGRRRDFRAGAKVGPGAVGSGGRDFRTDPICAGVWVIVKATIRS